jgi:hypothetical protein
MASLRSPQMICLLRDALRSDAAALGGCRKETMLALAIFANAWVLPSPRIVPARVASIPRMTAAEPQPASANPFESAGWPQLQGELDKLPVFTVANGEGQPLQYQVGDRPLAIFYADVDAAKKELSAATSQLGEGNCDIIPVGLGNAFKLSCDGKAMVVPGVAELQAAGAPPGAQPMGQELPLFACMEMSSDGEDGPVLPLFMSHADCAAAVAQATDADGPEDALEISCLSLPSVVERLGGVADDPSKGAFSFVAPSASVKHVESYVGNGVYWRNAETEEATEAEE